MKEKIGMDIETKYTDLTFFTNGSEDSILDRFKAVLKTVELFDILVYFRISGFHQLYKSFERIKIKDETNPMKILASIKRNLPEQFFNQTASAKHVAMRAPKKVILSEYLIK